MDVAAHESDPNITSAFISWANSKNVQHFRELVLERPVFTKYEISRNVHLMFTLNLMATRLSGYYNRNERVTSLLESCAQEFADRDRVVDQLNHAAQLFLRLRLKDPGFWFSKSNTFSLLSLLAEKNNSLSATDLKKVKSALDGFSQNPPADYTLAAKEGVNNRPERLLRRLRLDEAITASLRNGDEGSVEAVSQEETE